MRRQKLGEGGKFLGEVRKMPTADHVLDQMRTFVIRAGGPREHYDSKASWLARAARVLGLSHGRAAAYYYGKARSVSAQEWLAASAEIAALEQASERRRGELAYVESMDAARAVDRRVGRLADTPGEALRREAGAPSVAALDRQAEG